MAIAIYEEVGTGRKHWAESASPTTKALLATGGWVLFDSTPDTPPPASSSDALGHEMAQRLAPGNPFGDAVRGAFVAPAMEPEVRTVQNLIPSPLTTDLALWSTPAFGTGGAGSAAIEERVGFRGTPALVYRWATAPTDSSGNSGPNINPLHTNGAAVTAGLPYVGSMFVEALDTPGDVVGQAVIFFLNASTGALVSQVGGKLFTIRRGLGPQRIVTPVAKPPTSATVVAVPCFRVWTANQVGTGVLRYSAPQVEQATAVGPFRHGDMLGATWAGTPNASVSSAILDARDRIAAYGDSHIGQATGGGFTQATYLGEAFGRECWDGGRGGETSTGIAIRAGAVPVTVTVTGGSIPASGAVGVTVTVGGANPIFRSGTGWSFPGDVGGIDGTLTLAADGSWSFTRTATGSATTVAANAPFTPYEVATLTDLWIIQAGANLPNYARVLYDVQAMVDKCEAEGRDYLVLSLFNNGSEPSGSAAHTLLTSINAEFKRRWPQRYVDTRRWLIERGLTAAGLAATEGDTTAIGQDRIPPSLLQPDGIHLTPYARRVMAAHLVQATRARNLLRPGHTRVDTPVVVVGPRTVTPPASLGGLATPAAWFATNYAIGHRFTLETKAQLRYINTRIGTPSGNIQAGVVRLYGAGLVFYHRVMNTGIIAAPAAGRVSLDCGLTTLEPGEYGVFLWADNTTVTLPHAFPTSKALLDGKLALDLGTQPGGVPLNGNLGGSNGGYGERYISGLTLTDF